MKILFTLIAALFLISATAQKITYGSNPAAGRYVSVNGIKMYCEIYGKGKPLVMIHGNGGDISAFGKNIPYFAAKYQVIAVDSRGHGKTNDTRDSLNFNEMADDFAALLTELKIPSAYVLGWSDGGIIALLLAMHHPEKVTALASTGANLWPDSTALVPSVWKEMRDYVRKFKTKPNLTAQEKTQQRYFMLDWYQPNITLKSLRAVQCPALIIAGDHDVIVTAHTVKIYENIPKAYLWIIPKSSHSTLVEHAAEFNKNVDEFFIQGYTKM